MTEVPTSHWTARLDGETDTKAAPIEAAWRNAGVIVHVFTHFELRLHVYRADVAALAAPEGHWWSPADDVPSEALPTVMKKAIEAAIPGATRRKRPGNQGEA